MAAVTGESGGEGGGSGGGNGGGCGVFEVHLHALALGCTRRQTQPPKRRVSIVLHDLWNPVKVVVWKASMPRAVW